MPVFSFPDLLGLMSVVFTPQPVMTRNWEVHVGFKVHGKGSELFGDGFAIWYTKERMQTGPVFGSKDHFSGLAIILDTYSNHNGPHNVGNPRAMENPLLIFNFVAPTSLSQCHG